MLLLSDNDILVKLGLLGLLPDFLKLLGVENNQVYITESTVYSLPAQLKKYTKDSDIHRAVLELVTQFQKISSIDIGLLEQFSSVSDIDSGEAILATKMIENPSAYLATGDKRFLRAIKQTDFSKDFENRVYTFELALLLLVESIGYERVKSKILETSQLLDKPLDGLFKLAFRVDSTKDSDIECLISFTKDIQDLHSLV
ncbi:hypothetical protein [Actinobacillus porcinus]|uniref:hypothetical protein n=1 Tax=Actinobacillus porcinus TaxID=51048 RepID=UPI002A91C340|nr:hypothetical protein [Actinobacillus porcinus]MDY5847517.1 hypothetical protein [Actinobacillus porcinus]